MFLPPPPPPPLPLPPPAQPSVAQINQYLNDFALSNKELAGNEEGTAADVVEHFCSGTEVVHQDHHEGVCLFVC